MRNILFNVPSESKYNLPIIPTFFSHFPKFPFVTVYQPLSLFSAKHFFNCVFCHVTSSYVNVFSFLEQKKVSLQDEKKSNFNFTGLAHLQFCWTNMAETFCLNPLQVVILRLANLPIDLLQLYLFQNCWQIY